KAPLQKHKRCKAFFNDRDVHCSTRSAIDISFAKPEANKFELTRLRQNGINKQNYPIKPEIGNFTVRR
ncbi:MAG: hypothetical protein ACK5EY_12605, partial [Cyclobacteriaceae bacterium]